MVVEELFNLLQEGTRGCSLDNTKVTVAFFEIYGGFIQDLLNDRNRLKILEDGQGEIVVTGLQEHEAQDAPHLLEMVTTGNLIRTTHATEANDTSSRSHAICQVCPEIICGHFLCLLQSLTKLIIFCRRFFCETRSLESCRGK